MYFSDNFGKVLKTSEESLKNDIEKLDDIADNKELFQIYSKWDGTEPLACAFKIAMMNAECRCRSQEMKAVSMIFSFSAISQNVLNLRTRSERLKRKV